MTKNLHTGRVAGEPLFHISKRGAMPFWKSWLIRIASVIIALLVCGVLTYSLTGLNPIKVYATMLDGAFGTSRRIWMLAQELAILLLVALAVTPAFKMRFWNLGAEGQVLIGGLATIACMRSLAGKLPTPVYFIVMIASAVLAGAVWALIPALFKARWNANESLFTLMMNYIAMQLVDYFVLHWSGANSSGKLGLVETGVLPVIGGQKYLLNVIIVAAFTVIMYFYLRSSKHGYEIAVVGESENTARYIGINVYEQSLPDITKINTADAAGINVSLYKYLATTVGSAIAGLGGLYYVMDYANGVWSNNGFGDRGWLAIALVIFAMWKPDVSILGSILFGGLYVIPTYIPNLTLSSTKLFQMLPYVVTVLVLILTSIRNKKENQSPKSLGLSYFREDR